MDLSTFSEASPRVLRGSGRKKMMRQMMLYAFQTTALLWALVVCLRTVDLGWNAFAGIGLGMFGAIPISFLGIRIHSRHAQR
ncbi:MAG TPA: hypothetical protein VEI52_22375 [Terriglobales bacterium]|nr:hypothetical protein [Terriglobales bacterium]